MSDQKPNVDSLSPAATVSQTNPSTDTSLTGSPGGKVAAEVPVPKNFGRYTIEKELGKGAMGVVYLAEDSQIGRKVALKIPRKSAIEDTEALERFYREARTAGTLRHNNICPVYDVGAIDGVHYLTMAYIPGKPVSTFVNKEKLPAAKQVALLIRKIALALAEAHKQGVVHRDLKPSNVMLDDRNEPIVMDFGLARNSNTVENARLTQSGAILGTPAYMAPEQVRGEADEIGPHSDVYALGVMMYQFLTGELPFSGPILMVFAKILTAQPQKPSELRPDVDRTLEAICLKMMAKDTSQRFASMDDVAAALTEFLKTGTVTGLQITPAAPPPPAASPSKKSLVVHTEEQLRDLVELIEQLLLRNDYLEAIRLVGEIPDHERTAGLRRVLGDAYEMKSTVEKLERNLEKYLNQLDLPELKKTVNALLKIHPSHPRGKEVKKALNTGRKKDVALLRKNATHFDAAGNVWEPKVIAGAIGGIAALSVMVYFAVTIYLKNAKITVNNPNAVVEVKDNSVTVDGVQVEVEGDEKLGADSAAPPLAIAPFTADEAKAHQEAWAKYLGVPVEYANSIGMRFRLIPPGEYLVGMTQGEVDAHVRVNDAFWAEGIRGSVPQHKVILSKPFYLGINEVTQKEYQAVMGRNPSFMSPDGGGRAYVAGQDRSNTPVEYLSWADSAEFCVKLSEREKLSPAYQRDGSTAKLLSGNGYRLPTESEWEAACRAGTASSFWFGDDVEKYAEAGWSYEAGKKQAMAYAVGQKKPNPFGLYDVHGNVWEWCQDFFDPNAYQAFANQPAKAPTGPATGTKHVIRGGSMGLTPELHHSGLRFAFASSNLDFGTGFRVALPVDGGKQSLAASPKTAAPSLAVAPFTADKAKAHQQAWAKHLGVPVEWENSLGMKFVLIPPGEFLMGAASDDTHALPDEVPQHQVRLSKPYYLGVYEVTQREYERVTGANPSFFGKPENAGPNQDTTRWPVEQVGWNEAVDYCRQLTALADEQQEERNYRLPTEAEWEYACRAGTTTTFTFGNSLGSSQANFNGAYQIPRTSTGPWLRHPEVVGKYVPNAFGLYDTLGNVWEWCGDSKRTYDTQVQTDPRGPDNGPRLNRGGGWISSAGECRSSHRRPDNLRPEDRHRSTGLRVVCDVVLKGGAGRTAGDTAPAALNGSGRNVSPRTPFKNSLGMEFVLVPKGKSWLGGGGGKPGDKQVEITDDFYLGKYEVTQGEWEQVMGTNPSSFKNLSADRTAEDLKRFPVENVTWDDSQEFVKQVNQKLKEPGWTYRLPTDVEWEYACRNGPMSDKSQSAYNFYFTTPTNDLPPEQENFFTTPEKSLRRPCKVGSYQPNLLGLYDMHGNVSEWCQDEQKSEDGATKRTRRGGEWVNASWSGHAGYRHPLATSSEKSHYVGLRLVRVREGKSAAAPSSAVAPFNAEEAKAHQETWAKHLGVPVEWANDLGMKFVLVPPGEFLMGSSAEAIQENLKRTGGDTHWQACLRSEGPQHKVVLTKPFYMAITEVTQGQFQKVMNKNPSYYAPTGAGKAVVANIDATNLPVDMVTWNDATKFCEELSRQSSAPGAKYRLPTEAEWEFAGRAGTTTKFWSGDSDEELKSIGWIAPNSGGRPHAGGELPANPFGLHDIHGNVFEWVSDGWEESYFAKFQDTPAVDPLGPTAAETRILRGGDWDDPEFGCYISSRDAHPPNSRMKILGFRVVASVEGVQQTLDREEAADAMAVGTEASTVGVKSAHRGGDLWRYTFAKPGTSWMKAGFNDSDWKTGTSPFGVGWGGKPYTIRGRFPSQTEWKSKDIWLRKEFEVPPDIDQMRVVWHFFHDEAMDCYLNGNRIVQRGGWSTVYHKIVKPSGDAALKPGRNILAVHCKNKGGPGCIDVGVYWEKP